MNNKQTGFKFTAKAGEFLGNIGHFFTHLGRSVAPYALIAISCFFIYYVTHGAGLVMKLSSPTSIATGIFLMVAYFLAYAAMSMASGGDDIFDKLCFGVFFAVIILFVLMASVIFYSPLQTDQGFVNAAVAVYSYIVPGLVLFGGIIVALTQAIDVRVKPQTADETIAMLALPVVCVAVVIFSMLNSFTFGIRHGVSVIGAVAACITSELLMVGAAARAAQLMAAHHKGGPIDVFDLSAYVIAFLGSGSYLAAVSIGTINPAGLSPATLNFIIDAYSASPIACGLGLLFIGIAPRYVNIVSKNVTLSTEFVAKLGGGLLMGYLGLQSSVILGLAMASIGWVLAAGGARYIAARNSENSDQIGMRTPPRSGIQQNQRGIPTGIRRPIGGVEDDGPK